MRVPAAAAERARKLRELRQFRAKPPGLLSVPPTSQSLEEWSRDYGEPLRLLQESRLAEPDQMTPHVEEQPDRSLSFAEWDQAQAEKQAAEEEQN